MSRPLIPPAALHHSANTLALSKSSWSSPGRPANPGSANVATLMESPVTPCAVAPFASPGPQTSCRVPKVPPLAAAAAVEDDVDDAPEPLSSSLRLHPEAKITTTHTTTSHRRCFIRSPQLFGG